ncbi:sigma-54-dependent Fis family transcriptional regulator [Psychromonas sp. B3M02]|uniref:sigma-54-dependent transcriptional regulator n=1 Tax=Psychromonas sp. B3M02 TaxID=2267226 RepID=UPI000DE87082|nr:sigma-54 dependent transcriptional regulator [Psychromonas sp. B3M02]RBW42602.1 sigma-54-dependent Fis family transcriptional regulator [Psychromonas sp. B3M02]
MIFFIDDEEDMRIAHQQSFALADIQAQCFADAESALVAMQSHSPLMIISDIRLPGITGLQLLNTIQQKDADLPIVLITGHGDISMAVEAIRNGAYDFIEKPFASDRLIEITRKAIEKRQLTLENRELKRALQSKDILGPRIIGNTPSIVALKQMICRVADSHADILLYGETGTGKELVARSLHEQSQRSEHNFVAVNCGAVPENLIESELYGHEKGAFTGAESQRIGKFEYAQGGTLFLDEIESMPMQAQVRLLRVLQERTLERVGSNKAIDLDIRIIAATKVDLKETEHFRQDLYYRLNMVTLDLPPLRQRKEDIAPLFHHFLLVAAARYGKAAPALPADSLQALISHDWPGNVRELRNAAERFILLGSLSDLNQANNNINAGLSLSEQVEVFEKTLIEQALSINNGCIKDTMEALTLPRKTLYDKMQKHGLQKQNFKSEE